GLKKGEEAPRRKASPPAAGGHPQPRVMKWPLPSASDCSISSFLGCDIQRKSCGSRRVELGRRRRDIVQVGVSARLEHSSIEQERGPCPKTGCVHAGGGRPRTESRIIQLALCQRAAVNAVIEVATSYQHLFVLKHRSCVSLPALEHAAGCRPSAGGRVVQLCRGDR